MRVTALLVLACLACTVRGRRAKTSDDQQENLQKEGDTTRGAHSSAKLEQSQSGAQVFLPGPLRVSSVLLPARDKRVQSRAAVPMIANASIGDDLSDGGEGEQSSHNPARLETAPGRREQEERQREYELRRDAWLARYGSLQALQSTFGVGPPWGDLSRTETRSLYHALLPRALLGLHEMGLMKTEELAPLAYRARQAAKEYARSRCSVPGRLWTVGYEQYRSLKDRGRLRRRSLSWEEIWDKYEGQIVKEEYVKALNGTRNGASLDDDTMSHRIYQRILERSCVTNEFIDFTFLKKDVEDRNLAAIANQLEKGVRYLLFRPMDIPSINPQAGNAWWSREGAEEQRRKLFSKRARKAWQAMRKESRKRWNEDQEEASSRGVQP